MASKLTFDEKEMLIESVSVFPALYDKANDSYRNKNVCEDAWRVICEKFPGHGEYSFSPN